MTRLRPKRYAARVRGPLLVSLCWLFTACSTVREAPPKDPQLSVRAAAPEPPKDELPEGPFIEILGVAQDAGVPQAACSSPNCEAARRDPARAYAATSFVLVGSKGQTHLFEATPDIRRQLDRAMELGRLRGRPDAGRKWLDSVFVTHAHMGHYTGLMHLGFEAAHSQGVTLHASQRMSDFLATNQPWKQLVELKNIELYPLQSGEGMALESDLFVRPIVVPHRDELSDTVAWRIEGPHRTLLFLPDCDPWARWPERGFDAEAILEGVDVLLVDATFYSGEELPGRDLSKIGHPLVTDTMQWLKARAESGLLEVHLIHFNHSNPLLTPGSEARRSVEASPFGITERGQRIAL